MRLRCRPVPSPVSPPLPPHPPHSGFLPPPSHCPHHPLTPSSPHRRPPVLSPGLSVRNSCRSPPRLANSMPTHPPPCARPVPHSPILGDRPERHCPGTPAPYSVLPPPLSCDRPRSQGQSRRYRPAVVGPAPRTGQGARQGPVRRGPGTHVNALAGSDKRRRDPAAAKRGTFRSNLRAFTVALQSCSLVSQLVGIVCKPGRRVRDRKSPPRAAGGSSPSAR